MARVVHGKLSKSFQLEQKEKWLIEYLPEGVVENDEEKLLLDMNIQCDIRLLR